MNIAAIVPAFNEENTIGSVVSILKESGVFTDIIVVDDGSADHTAQEASKYGVRVLQEKNQGKGGALLAGARATDADILFFTDADLTNFTKKHIKALLVPVVEGKAAMSVGLRDRGPLITWVMERFLPLIGGEQAIHRDLFSRIALSGVRDFGIELAMNAYCRVHGLRIQKIRMSGVGQVVKEKKYGMVIGFLQRCVMIWQICRAAFFLRFIKKDGDV